MSSRSFKERFFSGVPRYEWIETLGRGGMGIVYKVRDKELDEFVAIKVLQPDFDGTEMDLLTRFKREINLNRKIKHPNVARIHDFGMSGEFPYITMEYIPGKDLKALIQDRGRIPPPEGIAILRQIARGTQAAHEVGIIHRDLKPQNVMVDDNGAVAILDFGLARGRTNENLTASSVVLGTPQYLSPEQALGGQADARSDIYSLGIIAFEMFTGEVPFIGDTPVATAMKQVTAPVPDTMAQFSDLPQSLRNIVHRALAKRPSDRFSSAADLESELAMLEHAEPASTEEKPKETRDAGTVFPDVFPDDTASRAAGPRPEAPPAARRPVWQPAAGAAPAPVSAAPVSHAPQPPFPQVPTHAPAPPASSGGPQPQAGPAAPQPAPQASRREKEKTLVRKRNPLILVVDSDSQSVLTSASALESAGTTVVVARSGPEALELLMRTPADLILMDINLPGMDGLDVTRILKARPELSQIPVLLMSSRLERSLFAFGIQAGAVDVVKKPLPEKALLAHAWQVLKRLGFQAPPGAGDVELPASVPSRLPRPGRP